VVPGKASLVSGEGSRSLSIPRPSATPGPLGSPRERVVREHRVEVWPPERLAERNMLIDRSLEALELAISSGFDDGYQLETDPDIDALRGDPRFVAVLEKLRTQAKAK
jgi:hypothetical protein